MRSVLWGNTMWRATSAEIARMRKVETGYQVDGITGGLAVKDQQKK